MPTCDLFVFRTMEEANLRYPRHARRSTDKVTSASALGRHAHPVIGARPQNVYLFWPVTPEAERYIRTAQIGLCEPRYYGDADAKPDLSGVLPGHGL